LVQNGAKKSFEKRKIKYIKLINNVLQKTKKMNVRLFFWLIL